MLSDRTSIVTALSAILPTYYELDCDSSTPVPCITYMEYKNDEDRVRGTLVVFSTLGYTIKIWAKTVSDVVSYSLLVDLAMKGLEYTRESSNELTAGNLICKILKYSAYSEEHLTGD